MRRYYLIDHRVLFFFSFVFYLVTPYVAGTQNWFAGFPGIELFQGYFKQIPDSQLFLYAWISLGWLVSFFLGHWLFGLLQTRKSSLELFPQTTTSWGISYISVLCTLMTAFLLLSMGGRMYVFKR